MIERRADEHDGFGRFRRASAACLTASLTACLTFALAVAPLRASTDDIRHYPSRPIHVVVPFGPGNQLDVFARLLGEHLADALGQPVIVDNRPGVSGNVASETVAKAAPDGYTLLVSGVLITLLPLTYGSRAVDPVVAFAPISRVAQQPIVIAVNPATNFNSLADLLAAARREPGKIAYGTSGVGTAQHIAMTMLSQRAAVELNHIPYANTGQLLADLLGGQIPVVMSFPGTVDPHLKSGRLKALAVTSAQRATAWPDIPTVAESGFPEFEVLTWTGVLAPAGTPVEIIQKLHREIVRILALPEVRSVFLAQNAEPVGNSPEEFAAEIKASIARWGPVVKTAGIQAN